MAMPIMKADALLGPEEISDLVPAGVTTRGELRELEAANIAEGLQWAMARKRDVLAWGYMDQLHRRMYGQVWRGAGLHRKTETPVGVAPEEITASLKSMLDDARKQIEARKLTPQEIAARFHHRLLKIHPFPNGNGRHARMMTNLLLDQLGAARFTWGDAHPQHGDDVRRRYLEALRAADARNYAPLIDFLAGE